MGRPAKTPVNQEDMDKVSITCPVCKEPKLANQFRVRVDKRLKFKKPLCYLNNVCKPCEAARQLVRYNKTKDDPKYKSKHAERARGFYHKHKDKIKVYTKQHRSRPKSRAIRKIYDRQHAARIKPMHSIVAKRWHEKHRDALSDVYCMGLIRVQTGLKRWQITTEMIEQKRISVKLKRKLYEVNKERESLTLGNHGGPHDVFSGANLYRGLTPQYADHNQ